MGRRRKKHRLLRGLLALIAAGVLCFLGLVGFVVIRENGVEQEAAGLAGDYDAIVILGAQVLPDGLSAFEVFADLHPDALAGCDVLQEHVRIMVVCEGIADAEDPDFIGGFRRLGQLEPLGLGGRGKDDGQDQAEDAFHGRVCYCFPAQAGQVPLTT